MVFFFVNVQIGVSTSFYKGFESHRFRLTIFMQGVIETYFISYSIYPRPTSFKL